MRLRLNLWMMLILLTACEGPKGEDGAMGETGVAGPRGEVGETGPQGEDGAIGSQGADGEAGPQGESGESGSPGGSGACAEVEALSILDDRIPSRLYQGSSVTVTPETNSADPSSLRFSFAGAGLDLRFTDNANGSFSITTGGAQLLSAPALYTVIVTDGCSITTISLALDGIYDVAARVSVANLTDTYVDVLINRSEDEYTIWNDLEPLEVSSESRVSVPTGDSTLYVYANSFFNDSPDDYDEEELITTIEGVSLELDQEYVVYLSYNEAGDIIAELVELTAPVNNTVPVMIAHLAVGAPPVNVIDLDTGSAVASGLAFGERTDTIELTRRAEPYRLGLDLNNDEILDALIEPLVLSEMSETLSLQVTALSVDGSLGFFVTTLDDEAVSGGFALPYVPTPETVEELIAALPYSLVGGYQNGENASMDDPSSFSISAPGAGAIRLQIDYVTEFFWDDFIVMGMSGLIYTDDGEGSVDLVIPGDYVLLGIDSDEAGVEAGWTVTGVEVISPEAIEPALTFCQRYQMTCGGVAPDERCLTRYYSAVAGAINDSNGATRGCYEYHLNLAEMSDPVMHCGHARGDELCVGSP